jgi:hypothetical protein
MDNCSPDNTPEVARSFGVPRVKHIRNETNLGHLRNFNKGVTLARGKYVWLISADDMLRGRHTLQRYVDVMESRPNVGYAFCRAAGLEDGKETGILRWVNCGDADAVWNGKAFLRRLIEHNCVVQASGMIRKECFTNVSLYPLDMPFACDWYIWCVFALHYDVAFFAEPMATVRLHEKSMTSSFRREDARICIGDELAVLWRVGVEAEKAGAPSLRAECNAEAVTRAARAVRAGAKGAGPALGEEDIEGIIHGLVEDGSDRKDFRAQFYMRLADEQYWDSEYAGAAKSYRKALQLRPWRPSGWAKYLLVRTGGLGLHFRDLYTHAHRSSLPRTGL